MTDPRQTFVMPAENRAEWIQRFSVRLAESYEGRRVAVSVEPHRRIRSLEQNRLQRLWMKQAAEQLADETPEQKRAYCKLHFGVPILCDDSEYFRLSYEKHVRGLPYETQLALMAVPFDFPVTRIMKRSQKREYLDRVKNHFEALGVVLAIPGEINGGSYG